MANGKVAYQGAPGAFSHAACLTLRPWDEAVAYATFEAAVDAVRNGECDCALIPVENTLAGRVEPAATLVEKSGLRQVAEVWRPIRLALMGTSDATASALKTAESHPVALKQCERYLADLGVEPREVFDTAGAARDVAAAGDRTRGAVAPAAAAELYGLRILRHDIQDSADNRTRFVVLSGEPA